MKKKSILLTALCATFVVSASMFTLNGGIKSTTANAGEVNGEYWLNYFDVESEGTVTFTSDQAAPSYNTSIYRTALAPNTSYGPVSATLGVEFTDDVTLTYKQPVLADNCSIYNSLLEFYVNPVKQSKNSGASSSADREFESFELRLEDWNDPTNFVAISIFSSTYDVSLGWAQAYATTVSKGGYHTRNSRVLADDRGAPIYCNFNGKNNYTTSVSYDNEDKAIYASRALYGSSITEYGNTQIQVMRDFDSQMHMVGSDTKFLGFNSDYLRLSVKLGSLTSEDPAHILLLSILGQDLMGSELNDVTKPVVVYPDDVNVDSLPEGEVNKFYPFIDAKAVDTVDGIVTNDIKFKVTDPDNLAVTNDAERLGFTPSKVGEYTVELSIADKAENKYVKTFKVEVKSLIEEINLTVNSPIQSTASIGEVISVPGYKVTGGSGIVDVETRVLYDNRNKSANVVNGEFEVVSSGVYYVSYVVTDYLLNKKYFEYAINTSYSKAPIINSTFTQSVVTKGHKINFIVPDAYDYYTVQGTKLKVPVTVEVSENGSAQYNKVTESYYIPSANATTVSVRYSARAQQGEGADYLSVTEPVVVNVIELEKFGDLLYDVYDNIDVEYLKDSQYSSNKEANYAPTADGATLEYVNPVPFEAFSINMTVRKEQSNFKKISFRLTDSKNSKQVITISLEALTNNKTYVHSVYGYSNMNGCLYNSDSDVTFGIKVKLKKFLYDSTDSMLYEFTKFDNGEKFEGFDSGKVYMQIIFDEVDLTEGKTAAMRFSEFVSLATITDKDPSIYDIDSPKIALSEHVNTYNGIRQEIKVPSAISNDMISPECPVYVSVYDPDNNFILGTATNGVLADKDYTITLEKYGVYNIVYTCEDEAYNVTKLTRTIKSVDNIDPVIEINGQIKSKYTVGEELYIPEYKATDNYTAQEDLVVYVYLTTPSFGYKLVSLDGTNFTYKFSVAGKYDLTFYVRDSLGNYCIKSFTFTVA